MFCQLVWLRVLAVPRINSWKVRERYSDKGEGSCHISDPWLTPCCSNLSFIVHQWFSNCVPSASSISITLELLSNAVPWPLGRVTTDQKLCGGVGVWARHFGFLQAPLPQGILMHAQSENHPCSAAGDSSWATFPWVYWCLRSLHHPERGRHENGS